MINDIIGSILIGITLLMMFYLCYYVGYDRGYLEGFESCINMHKEITNKEWYQ